MKEQVCITLGAVAKGVEIEARNDGIWVVNKSGVDLTNTQDWKKLKEVTPVGEQLKQSLPYLIEQEFVLPHPPLLTIPYETMYRADPDALLFLTALAEPLSFSVHVEGTTYPGHPDFSFSVSFRLGRKTAHFRRAGPFLTRNNQTYRLPLDLSILLDEVDRYNALPKEQQGKEAALRTVAAAKNLSEGGVVELEDLLAAQEVIIPSRVKVDIEDRNGFLSLMPQFDGVDPKLMANAFKELSEVQHIYDIRVRDDKYVRVILNQELRAALRDMQRVRHVTGETRRRALIDPLSCLSEGIDRDLVDCSVFAERVKDIGDAPYRAKVSIKSGKHQWKEGGEGDETPLCSIDITKGDQERKIDIANYEELLELKDIVEEGRAVGDLTAEWRGESLVLDEPFVTSVESAAEEFRFMATKTPEQEEDDKLKEGGCKYLIIYTNQEEREFQEGSNSPLPFSNTPNFVAPRGMRKTVTRGNGQAVPLELKDHQVDGIAWLHRLFRNRASRRGCLLADDMGLGKTLQLLTFLAGCIDGGYGELASDEPPWEPVLVVAPLILLKNWEREAHLFFEEFVFCPTLILHGSALKKLQVRKGEGRELELGEPTLDLEEITRHRLVITNYDTVKNYQHSLARVKWSIIIADEAQEIKEQNARSDAMKAMKCAFRIACTGTPVENRLLDLWNLIDFIQPGWLGSAREFAAHYERGEDPADGRQQREQLREALAYGRPDAMILRREKREALTALPAKIEKTEVCPLSTKQRELHLEVVRHLNSLKMIDSLKKLYLDPRLLQGSGDVLGPGTAVRDNPKIQLLLRLLEGVKQKREKALVFSDSIQMQNILKLVIDWRFGLDVHTINGTDNPASKTLEKSREGKIAAFEGKEGFNVLILSQKVAGVGLTIVGANHVFHYSRWWNPAKESQATDRAYRIGQTKDVHVYYLVAVDPQGEFDSFEEKLDNLLSSKMEIASDFLIPSAVAALSDDEMATAARGAKVVISSPVPLTADDVDALGPYEFEGCIAALYERMGYSSYLTPKSGDVGLDVVAIKEREVVVTQVKHTACSSSLPDEAIAQVADGYDYYKSHVFPPGFIRCNTRLCIVTNSDNVKSAKKVAAGHDDRIEICDRKALLKLLKTHRVTAGDVYRAEHGRFKDKKLLKEALLKHKDIGERALSDDFLLQ